ncbi:MAG: hypothetical protein ABL955_07010 [Elusimicrobiota bacterium]
MINKTRTLCLLIAAAALFAPAHAVAGAQPALREPANFDGARARPEKDPVRAGAPTDNRTPEQIANEEQTKADARVDRTEPAPASAFTVAPAAHADGIPNDRLIGGLMGATFGLLGGGLLAYGLSRLTA